MKKLVSLLFLSLIIGLGNLSAQTPMQQDTKKNTKNKMHNDSMSAPKNNMVQDSMMQSKNARHEADTMPSVNARHKDSMMHSKNTRNDRDSMASANGWQTDSMMTFNQNIDGKMNSSSQKMQDNKGRMMTANTSNWPEASRIAVDEITTKYGKPDGVTTDELIWLKKGVWKKITINKMESKHNFPIEHTDMMQTTINYNVPEDKMDDLGKFDGSITFDRTQGTMSARCDKEANNFLALNLANDIIMNKKTVDQARKAFGAIVKEKMKGGNPAYMVKLTFGAKSNTADPDKNTTGLTKDAVTKPIAQNNNN